MKIPVFDTKDALIQQWLQQLHPFEDKKENLKKYHRKKLAAVFIIIFIGMLSVTCSALCSRGRNKLTEGTFLMRKEKGEGSYLVNLQARIDDWVSDIPILVEERQLTKEERNKLLDEVKWLLPDLVKGENTDFMHITEKLNFIRQIQGYPFVITWKSNNYKRIKPDGSIESENLSKQGEKVVITAVIDDGEEKSELDFEVKLVLKELSEEEKVRNALVEEIEKKNNDKKTNAEFVLPTHIAGKSVFWEEKSTQDYLLIIVATIIGIILVCRGMDRDLEKELKKRRRQLLMDYPECVSKLRLYLSAGLTVKKTFFRIATDYQDNLCGKRHYLYEEMLIACHQLENGMMEEKVYRQWGHRCGEMRFKQLGFLLAVHVKRGNSQLLEQLEKEAESAREDRRNQAKKLGEEAGVKLLFPMMLMLLIVMLLILLPAWLNFGQI